VERNLAYLLPENLHRFFNETDVHDRKAAIADLWDEGGIFIDSDGAHHKDPRSSAPSSRLYSSSFRAPCLRSPLRFRRTSVWDAFSGSTDRPADPLSPKAST
jgi:hypothetical protein